MFFDDVASRETLSRAVADGRIRWLAPRLYTADLLNDRAGIVVGSRWRILGRMLPAAVIADRSAARAAAWAKACRSCWPREPQGRASARRTRERTPMSKR